MKFRPLLFFLGSLLFSCQLTPTNEPSTHPNILWITCEDLNPMLGCYGDTSAISPNIDQLAEVGIRYTNAFATAPVCSPSRSCLITGVYATTLGTQHLRSYVEKPGFIKGFPRYMREAGYYCTNNYKEDYNFTDTTIWDESSKKAHWRNRKEGQPFFSVFNLDMTHQSQIFGSDEDFHKKYGHLLTEEERQLPDVVPVPPYYPNTPEIRKMLARYYDLVTIMDRKVGEILEELQVDGLSENTIVFFYSDHGTGMPRGKRSLYDSGLQVPLIVYVPGALQARFGVEPGAVEDRPVSFVDFPPTVLNMLGLEIPEYMQGQAFLGPDSEQEQHYVYGTSDRVDEAFEMSRSVRDKDYLYIRNYLPQLPLIQPNYYTDKSEIMQALLTAKETGRLNPVQQDFWRPKRTVEELYDVKSDPFQIHNLSADPDKSEVLSSMRAAHKAWLVRTHDTGLMPEPYIYRHLENEFVYEMTQKEAILPIERIWEIVESTRTGQIDALIKALDNDHELIQYWAINGLEFHAEQAKEGTNKLIGLLKNSPSPSIRLAALKALCGIGECQQHLSELVTILKGEDEKAMLLAARTFEELRPITNSIEEEVRDFQEKLLQQVEGKWEGYDLYASWALREAFKNQGK